MNGVSPNSITIVCADEPLSQRPIVLLIASGNALRERRWRLAFSRNGFSQPVTINRLSLEGLTPARDGSDKAYPFEPADFAGLEGLTCVTGPCIGTLPYERKLGCRWRAEIMSGAVAATLLSQSVKAYFVGCLRFIRLYH